MHRRHDFYLSAEPDRRCRWQVVARGLNAMDEIDPGLRERTRGVNDLALTCQIEVAATKVGDAVPSIGAREVKNMEIACLMPCHLLRGH